MKQVLHATKHTFFSFEKLTEGRPLRYHPKDTKDPLVLPLPSPLHDSNVWAHAATVRIHNAQRTATAQPTSLGFYRTRPLTSELKKAWTLPYFDPSAHKLGEIKPTPAYLCSRTLRCPLLSPTADQEHTLPLQEHLKHRTFHSFFESPCASASLSLMTQPKLFNKNTQNETINAFGGLTLAIPPAHLLCASSTDQDTPLPLDLIQGRRLRTFAQNTILEKTPTDLLEAGSHTNKPHYNELFFLPTLYDQDKTLLSSVTITGLFVCSTHTKVGWPDHLKPFWDLSETHNLPLIHIKPTPQYS